MLENVQLPLLGSRQTKLWYADNAVVQNHVGRFSVDVLLCSRTFCPFQALPACIGQFQP